MKKDAKKQFKCTPWHGSQVGRLGDWNLEVILTFPFGIPTESWLAARPFQLPFNFKCVYVFDGVLQLTSFTGDSQSYTLKFL